MKCLLLLLITAAAVALAKDDGLKAALASPEKMVELYKMFKGEHHLTYSGAEDSMRFRLFKLNARFVADENEVEGETAHFGLNFMSTMTEAEKQSYLGLNVTGHMPNPPTTERTKRGSVPSEKLWMNEGKVTEVKNQGSCGSCWTFGAVGGLETRYAKISGVLRNFAEQEYLDCVYDTRDGCYGGFCNDCYDYSVKAGGRLAATSDYSYTALDGTCKSGSTKNALVAAKITGYVAVEAGESAVIAALADGALAMALKATSRFQSYSSGVLLDYTCRGRANHAVTGVGYTPTYIVVKNSWGSEWGDHGFVKLSRNYESKCHLFEWASYPVLAETGEADSGDDDAATSYNPHETDNEEAEAPCENWWVSEDTCRSNDISRGDCQKEYIVKKYCRKYCCGTSYKEEWCGSCRG